MKSVVLGGVVYDGGVSELGLFFVVGGLLGDSTSLVSLIKGLKEWLPLSEVGFNLRECFDFRGIDEEAVVSVLLDLEVFGEVVVELNLVLINKSVLNKVELSRNWEFFSEHRVVEQLISHKASLLVIVGNAIILEFGSGIALLVDELSSGSELLNELGVSSWLLKVLINESN